MNGSGRRVRVLLSALAFPVALLAPDATFASTYDVRECSPSQGQADDVSVEGQPSGYMADNGCGSPGVNFLQIGSSGAVSAGQAKAWAITAPDGTRINEATGNFLLEGSADHGGHASFFFYRGVNQGSDQILDHQGAGNSAGQFRTSLFGIGAVRRLGVGVYCKSGSTCPGRSGIYARMGDLNMSMEDTVAPDAPTISGPAVSGWVSGSQRVDFSVSDTGAGIYTGNTLVNGSLVDFDIYCFPATDGSGAVTKMKPCPSNSAASSLLDTTTGPFVQGENTVRVCGYEYGEEDRQAGCRTETVRVDGIAPSAPQGLTVAGGDGWKRDNDFDLSWSNPPQSGTAPIAGASVRLTGPGGYDTTTFYSGSGKSSIDNVQVPAVGDYTARVFLRDEAGNESTSNAATIHLRFDNTVPQPKEPTKANGWINREDLVSGYQQSWDNTPPAEVPPSGIAGYRVVVNANSDTDPCSGSADPRACGAPITEVGIGNRTRLLHAPDLIEGTNYVHVVPISGSGMRATTVKHGALKVDLTDPEVQVQGSGDGQWLNHDAELTLVATDVLSGMVDTDEYPLDEPPRVELSVDGSTFGADGDRVSTTVAGEGVHDVTWCARDLAGNGECPAGGSGGSATVRIDKTPPTAAFTNSQDPEDPDQLVAPVADALSGVVSGEISYRQAGGSQWKSLETTLSGDRLVARVDSNDLDPGITYEFRVESVDAAGNTATSTAKQNGEPMRVIGPFRPLTSIAGLRVNGKPAVRLKYGKRPPLSGTLTTADGRPVADAPVELQSTYATGSRKASDAVTVVTAADGGFSAVLPKGPSRLVEARFAGNRRYLGSTSKPVKATMKSAVTLKAPRRVDSDRGVTFTGRIKSKGAELGKKGKRVEVQVRIGKRWKTVGRSIRTSSSGRYRLKYRFTAQYTEPVTFVFRTVVLRDGGFPYLPSASKQRHVTVTP